MSNARGDVISWEISDLYERMKETAEHHKIGEDRFRFEWNDGTIVFESLQEDGENFQKFRCQISCVLSEPHSDRVFYRMKFISDSFERLYEWRGMGSSVAKILLSMREVGWHKGDIAQHMLVSDMSG